MIDSGEDFVHDFSDAPEEDLVAGVSRLMASLGPEICQRAYIMAFADKTH